MKELKADIYKVISTTAIIALLIVVLSSYYYEENNLKISPEIRNYIAAITFAISVIHWLFDKYIWTIIPEQARVYLGIPPNLNGRWKGSVSKLLDNKEIPFLIEIKQDFSGLSYKTYTANSGGLSSGSSINATIFIDKFDSYIVVTNWSNEYSLTDNNRQKRYYGSSKWVVTDYKNNLPGKINYSYFTERNSQGKVNLEFVSRKLVGNFNEENE